MNLEKISIQKNSYQSIVMRLHWCFFLMYLEGRNQEIHNTVAVDEASTVKNIVQTVQLGLQDTKIFAGSN